MSDSGCEAFWEATVVAPVEPLVAMVAVLVGRAGEVVAVEGTEGKVAEAEGVQEDSWVDLVETWGLMEVMAVT